jgi:hypothetical protein
MTDTVTPEYTEEQIAEMRAVIAADDARRAAEQLARREAYLAPVKALLASPEIGKVYAQLHDMRANYAADDSLSIHVNALEEIMPRLALAAGVPFPPAEAAIAASAQS